MKRTFLIVATVALTAGLAIQIPATALSAEQSKPGPPKSYLYVVDGAHVEVTPGKGRESTIEVTKPRALAFTDRPYRHEFALTVPALLREFGWSRATGRLGADTPNAAVSIAGAPSQIVDIVSARVTEGRLLLKVVGVSAPLKAREGPGSLFIDNVFVFSFPWSQTVILDTRGFW